jgi:hypothetical protein
LPLLLLLLLPLQAQHGWQECAHQAGSTHHHTGAGEGRGNIKIANS